MRKEDIISSNLILICNQKEKMEKDEKGGKRKGKYNCY